MGERYEDGISVLIGRFQPFHLGHLSILNKAIETTKHCVVVIGGHMKSCDVRNPWSSGEREIMIKGSLSSNKFSVVRARDYWYNDNTWMTEIQNKIRSTVEDSKVYLIGFKRDRTSYYLDQMFPQWKTIYVKEHEGINGTTVREDFFEGRDIGSYVTPFVAKQMEDFTKTKRFEFLKDDYEFLKKYKKDWEKSPYPPTFVTTDAVVIKSGHVLMVRRKHPPGVGQLALPGGFLGQGEALEHSMLRELNEETNLRVPRETLQSAIKASKVFDHPDRSLRGRTITHAYLVDLGIGPLPKVEGGDDAAVAQWMSINELFQSENEVYEDHLHIVSYFLGRN